MLFFAGLLLCVITHGKHALYQVFLDDTVFSNLGEYTFLCRKCNDPLKVWPRQEFRHYHKLWPQRYDSNPPVLTIVAWLAIMPWLPTMPCCCCCCMRVYGLVALMGYCNEGCWGDTFMSRDTLLTGRPLPGWPGRTPPKSADKNKWVLSKCAAKEKPNNKIVQTVS